VKAVFYCFSGTGNTLRMCERIKAAWEQLGHEGEIIKIRDGVKPEPSAYDRVVVAYPVHAFNAPAPVLEFLKKFPRIYKGKRSVFLARTSGEPVKMNDASGVLPARILKRRGYLVKGEFHHVMPYNIIFRHSDGMAARMDRASRILAPVNARDLERGEGRRYRTDLFMRIAAFFLRIEHPAMPVIGLTFRKKNKKCVGCGKCEKICPRGNISMKNGKPHFGGHCVGCMGCVFSCPTDAIRPSLLNGWRVNGAYTYEGEPASDKEICRYCKKAYIRYFHEAENLMDHDEQERGAN